MKKYIVSSADWKKEIKIKELDSEEETIFEASTRAVEWAMETGKSVGIFVVLEDPQVEAKEFLSLAYKALNNAGYYNLAEDQRKLVKEEFDIDLAENDVPKLISKIQKASAKKLFCIAKITELKTDNRVSKVPIVCLNLGLYQSEQAAKTKCKELNASVNEKIFIVKKIFFNEEFS